MKGGRHRFERRLLMRTVQSFGWVLRQFTDRPDLREASRRGKDWINSDTNWPPAPPMVASSCSCNGSDCLVDGGGVSPWNVTQSIASTYAQPGSEKLEELWAYRWSVFNGRLMVPVSSSNYTNSMKAFSRRDASIRLFPRHNGHFMKRLDNYTCRFLRGKNRGFFGPRFG